MYFLVIKKIYNCKVKKSNNFIKTYINRTFDF
jgi:hypothetical protein